MRAITYVLFSREAADNVAKIWSPFSGELIRNLSGHTEGLSDIAWSPNSVYLATASDDHTIRIWDVDSVCTYLNKTFVFMLNCGMKGSDE
jgi:COMPASS component SWD3